MPSRLKIVLKDNYGKAYLRDKKNTISSLVSNIIIWGKGLPANWAEMRLRERLMFLKQFLPPGWVLEVYVEPKGTRKEKSVYRKAQVEPVNQPKIQIRNRPRQVDWDAIIGRNLEIERGF